MKCYNFGYLSTDDQLKGNNTQDCCKLNVRSNRAADSAIGVPSKAKWVILHYVTGIPTAFLGLSVFIYCMKVWRKLGTKWKQWKLFVVLLSKVSCPVISKEFDL